MGIGRPRLRVPDRLELRGPGVGSARWTSSCSRSGAAWPEVCSRSERRPLCRAIDPTKRLYLMTRHFVWLTPLANLVLFIGLGLCLTVVTRLWPRRGAWLSSRLIVVLALLPALWAAGPRIYQEAWFVVALGTASQMVPRLERDPTRWRRRLVRGSAGLVGLVLILAGFVFGGDWLRQRREAGRPLPPTDSPNVLLIVMDTVRRSSQPLWLRTPHHADAGAAGAARHPLRRGARDRALDARLTRQLLHRPLAP